MGRPPLPVEVKRRRGRTASTDSGGRPLPAVAEVVPLPRAEGMPEFPGDLGDDGRTLWRQIWAEGITWISPATDLRTAEEACRLADDLAAARKRYRATTDPSDARAMVAVQKPFMEALSALGFSPVARSRLGVAEVRRVSALEKLIEKRRTS